MLRNALLIIGGFAVSTAYFWASPSFVSDEYALVVNFVAMPLVLGLLAGYFMRGFLLVKILLLALIPIAHVLVFGGDAAKPGLENLLALVEFVPLCVGCVAGHFLPQRKAPVASPRQ